MSLGVGAEHVILCGDLSHELPRQRSKVVRIFTSSTFTGKPYFLSVELLGHVKLDCVTLIYLNEPVFYVSIIFIRFYDGSMLVWEGPQNNNLLYLVNSIVLSVFLPP